MTRPHDMVGLCAGVSGERAHSLARGESRYKICIVAGGRPFVSQYSAAGLRYSAATGHQHAATRPAIRPSVCVTRHAVRAVGFGLRYNFCIMTGVVMTRQCASVTRPATRLVRAATRLRQGQAWPRYGTDAGHDTA